MSLFTLASASAQKFLSGFKVKDANVDAMFVDGILTKLEEPVHARNFECPFCGTQNGYVIHDGKLNIWICDNKKINARCSAQNRRFSGSGSQNTSECKRSIEWPLFCEINNIGDVHHDVRFESLYQSQQKIDYLAKFARNPNEILVMQGKPGTGKSYSAMATCELFTRFNSSALFFTQEHLSTKWTESLRDNPSIFKSKLITVSLLVVDDFGIGDIPQGFMKFFFDVMNARMQWKNKGTIITTNLDAKQLALVCGDSLVDRLNTGQLFEFSGTSRRKKPL